MGNYLISSTYGVHLSITGKVQGVGFRPFVYKLALRFGFKGEVWNQSEGVTIRLFQPDNLEAFLQALKSELPPLAKIDSLSQEDISWQGAVPHAFTIMESQSGTGSSEILPDIATCPECLTEMNNPKDRRYRYPFLNCTNCGPRFSIIKEMPYDRPKTSMAGFPLCEACAAEYHDPLNRRFHAQPVACPKCGPQITCCTSKNSPALTGEEALQAAISALLEGKIVAIKALGGFHLACLATKEAPIKVLRARKHRPAKPFAVMLPDAGWLSHICAPEVPLKKLEELLSAPAAPIILVRQAEQSPLSPLIAPDLAEIGIMLPANPLQHLLLQGVKQPLVMTSGNRSHFAPALSHQEALDHLQEIADLFLFHNREIVERADDSVMRLLPSGKTEILRRGRGFAPESFPLPEGFPKDQTILALGGDLKNSFCLLHQDRIFTGPHFGDLNQGNVFFQWESMLAKFPKLYHATPKMIACDAHPAYQSHQWAKRQNLPVTEIFHHHAHLAACLGEKQIPNTEEKYIALALDGLGYGIGGKIWGGECFLANYQHFEYLGGLPAVPLLGGDLAAKEPWRNLLAQFENFVPNWEKIPESAEIKKHPYQVLLKAMLAGINAPPASSCGRLFEAVAAALKIAPEKQSYEGEAACLLETLARKAENFKHPVKLPLKETMLDLAVFWESFLSWEESAAEKAWAFHDALAKGFADLAVFFAEKYQIKKIILTGGCLHNALLKERFLAYLSEDEILTPSEFPAGDGGIAFGQALIALALL